MTGLTKRLAESHIPFVVVGGMAGVLQGSSLMTRDIDVACDMTPETLASVWLALADLHPVHRMTPERLEFTQEQARSGRFKNLYLSTDLGPLDLLGEIKGLGGFTECLGKSEIFTLGEAKIRVLTLDALIEAKHAMGRPRDIHATIELEAIREARRQSAKAVGDQNLAKLNHRSVKYPG